MGGVLGVGVGLLLALLCALYILAPRPLSAPAADVLAGELQLDEARLGELRLDPQARLLPSGEEVLVLSDGIELAVDPAELTRADSPGGHGSMGRGRGVDVEPYDWGALESEQTGAPPARLYLVHFPAKRGEEVLRAQFRGLEWRDLSEIGKQGGVAVVGGGKLDWCGYEADWVRERRFIPADEQSKAAEGEPRSARFRDTLRVNLTLGRHVWIAYAIWQESSEGSVEVVEGILGAFSPAP